MAVKSGDTLYAYSYLDPDHPPQAVMLQWNDGDWNQRAYWGQNLINWGTNGTSSRRYMGHLPASGGWVRLEVPAAQVGLAGKTVNGLAFTLYGGRAWWDRAGVRRAVHEVTKYYEFNGQRIARRQDGVLTYLHTDHLGSTLLETNSSGTMVGEHRYRAYGSRRGGDELATDHRFTGQKLDGTGLYYYNARYYDPALGTFISPDPIVPDPTNLLDYNRYLYVRGRPLNMNDPSGHEPQCDVGTSACDVEWGLWRQYQNTERAWGSWERFQQGYNHYAQYAANPEKLLLDRLVANRVIGGDFDSALQNIGVAQNYAESVLHEGLEQKIDPSLALGMLDYLQSQVDDATYAQAAPVVLAAAGLADINGVPSRRGIIRGAQLPTSGRIRYVPPENWRPTQPLPRGPQNGYMDTFDNEWVRGPSRTLGQPFEWDVQLSRTGQAQLGWASRDGRYLNVSLDGHITH